MLPQHRLSVLHRRAPSKSKLAAADRLSFVWLYRPFPSVLDVVAIVSSTRRTSGGIGRASACTGANVMFVEVESKPAHRSASPSLWHSSGFGGAVRRGQRPRDGLVDVAVSTGSL